MNKITTIIELKESILLLEAKQGYEAIRLKEQFEITYEGLKPINLIVDKLNEFATSPGLKGDISSAALSLISIYLSKNKSTGEAKESSIKKWFSLILHILVSGKIIENFK